MGNAESGPEMTSPRHKGTEKSNVATTSLIYSGGKARAVPGHWNSQASKQEADVRQPSTAHHVKFDGTARDIHEDHGAFPENNTNTSLQNLSSTISSQVVRPPVTFHTIPVEKVAASNTDWVIAETPDVEFNNSILHSGSKGEENDIHDDDGEVAKLYKSIAKLGTDVIEATAAVYHYLETKSMDDEMTVAGRSNTVLQYIKNAAERGNTEPAYKFLETAKAVAEVLDDEDDEEDDDDSNPGLLSLLRDGHDQQSVSDRSLTLTRLLEETGSLNGGGSIFRMLEADEIVQRPVKQRNKLDTQTAKNLWNMVSIDCDDDCLPLELLPVCSPRTQTTQKARGAVENFPPLQYFGDTYVPEAKSTSEDSEDGHKWITKDLYTERGKLGERSNSARIQMESPSGSQLDLTDLPHMHGIDENMDLEFVEHFDLAFNDFIAAHPKFLADHPDLVHSLRIIKLQQLLEHNDTLERELKAKVESSRFEKESIEETLHGQLKEAARKKAARQTFLQSELNNLSWSTKRVQAQLRWKFLQYSEDRAKRQFKMRQQFKAIPQANTRQDLIALIPEDSDGRRLKDVVQAAVKSEGSKPYMLSAKQEDQLREYQAENSVMSAELSILTKKAIALQMEAKKYAWVESVLVRLDEGTIYKLKAKFQKKEGVSKL